MVKQKNRNITGFANLGNTCFLNSCLQILNHTYELDVLNKIELNKNIIDTVLLKEWIDLKNLYEENFESNNANINIISPNRFVNTVQEVSKQKNNMLFSGWSQNDFSEFLFLWIDCVHNSISRKLKIKINGNAENQKDEMALKCYKYLQEIYAKDYSELYDLFYGMYMTIIYDKDKKNILSMKPEHFFILDMQLFYTEENREIIFHDIYQLFDNFVNFEYMSGENAWYNETTEKKQDIYKTIRFWNLPNILVISLKRFSTDGKRKLQHLINFPLEDLNLSKYVSGYHSKKYIYDLYAVCNHYGNLQGGHYTSFVKCLNRGWLHFNDTLVENVHESKIVSPSAYCLFYRKRDFI